MKRFQVGPQIYYESGAVKHLYNIDAKKAFIVTDKFMVQFGLVDRVTKILDDKNINYEVFSNVEPNPSLEIVTKGLEYIIKTKPDLLIAIGGGSSIDAAKAIVLFYMKMKKKMLTTEITNKPYFVAIPTTSGTGSEVTSYSVITDKKNNIKIPLKDDEMIPNVAIVDCDFTETVPPSVTADTGMDVLTHAIEAYVSNEASDYTDIYAEKAINIVFNYLLRAYKNGNDQLAREKMHNASCMAGIAFTNASVGINHSLAHALGAKFKLPHGRANAILLPYVIKYNSGIYNNTKYENIKVAERYAQISKTIGLPSSSVEEGVISLIEAVKILNRKLNIPLTIEKAGVSKEEFESNLIEMSETALQDICTVGNPRVPTKAEILQIFKEAYTG